MTEQEIRVYGNGLTSTSRAGVLQASEGGLWIWNALFSFWVLGPIPSAEHLLERALT